MVDDFGGVEVVKAVSLAVIVGDAAKPVEDSLSVLDPATCESVFVCDDSFAFPPTAGAVMTISFDFEASSLLCFVVRDVSGCEVIASRVD